MGTLADFHILAILNTAISMGVQLSLCCADLISVDNWVVWWF
jgi:hypothetical protein